MQSGLFLRVLWAGAAPCAVKSVKLLAHNPCQQNLMDHGQEDVDQVGWPFLCDCRHRAAQQLHGSCTHGLVYMSELLDSCVEVPLSLREQGPSTVFSKHLQ